MQITPRKELLRQLKLFCADPKRGISLANFAEIAGISRLYLRHIVQEKAPMSEISQRRLSKALNEFRMGKIATVQHFCGRTEPVYRKKPVPLARKTMGLTVQNGEIKLSIGLRQLGDYTKPTFGELLDKT